MVLLGWCNGSLAVISYPLRVLKMMAEGSWQDLIVLSKLSMHILFLQKSREEFSLARAFQCLQEGEGGVQGLGEEMAVLSPNAVTPWQGLAVRELPCLLQMVLASGIFLSRKFPNWRRCSVNAGLPVPFSIPVMLRALLFTRLLANKWLAL